MNTNTDIVAYVGTIWDYIDSDTTEDEIRDMITADMKLMDEEQRKFTEDHLEEIIEEDNEENKEVNTEITPTYAQNYIDTVEKEDSERSSAR